MAQLRIGTCSWKYASWEGLVYSGPRPDNYLREYAGQFSTVEIDQWFWSLFGVDEVALPSPETVAEYLAVVPPDFKFSIKMPNSLTLTHFYRKSGKDPLVKNPYFLSADVLKQFLALIAPLKAHLGPLMFQFEYLNRRKMPSQAEFQKRFSRFLQTAPAGYSWGIEVRNPNYLNRDYFDFLGENDLRHVFLQGYYMPPVAELYRKFGGHLKDEVVLRLQGPDRSGIEKISGGLWNRIYEPRDRELADIAEMINELLDRNLNVYVNMNNHYEGSAPLSIRRLEKFLGGTGEKGGGDG